MGFRGVAFTSLDPNRRNESGKAANQQRRNIMKVEIIETFDFASVIISAVLTDILH